MVEAVYNHSDAQMPAPSPPSEAPAILAQCVTFLYKHALKLPMLFEIKAAPRDVAQLREAVQRGQDLAGSNADPHVVANLLLRDLREMPAPLLGFEHYDKWVEALGKHTIVSV